MRRPSTVWIAVWATASLLAAGRARGFAHAVAVSPGAAAEAGAASEVAGGCPTFSWSPGEGGAASEFAVLELKPDGSLDDARLLLRRRVAAGASSWTPGRAECLAPGRDYIWLVRAVRAGEETAAADWSAPLHFRVAAAPSAEEVRAALAVLERWRAGAGPDAIAAPPAATAATASRDAGTVAPGPHTPLVGGAAAIHGEMPDTSGAVFGVFGVSHSAQGAALAARNETPGADLVLDGAAQGQADTHLTQSGLDRPSGSAQTFSFQNSGGGGMALQVQGVAVSLAGHAHSGEEIVAGIVADARIATTLARDSEVFGIVLANDGPGSGLDADTLDGVTGTSYQLRVTGTCPPGQAITGVNSNGTVDCYEVPVPPRLTTVDSAGSVGYYSSIAIGTDGLPVISHWDVINQDLKVSKCNDTACAPGGETSTTVDFVGNVGHYSSLAIGGDGFPVISYRDATNGDVKVVKCDDAACAPGGETFTTVDSAGDVGNFTSLAVGSDGFPVISYLDVTNGDLKVAKCNNATCSSVTLTTVDSAGSVGFSVSLAIGTDSFPVISYYDQTNTALKVVKCNDAACAPGGETFTTLDSAGDVGTHTSLAAGTDGFPVISYKNVTNGDLKVVKCDDAACAPGGETLTTVASAGDVGNYTALAIGTDGFPVISYEDATNGDLVVVKCNDAAGAPGGEIFTTVDSGGIVGWYTSLALGTDGFPVISYLDASNVDLKVAKCRNASCRD